MKRLSLDYPGHILVLSQSVQDFIYGAFRDFLCRVFVHLAAHHIELQSLETFHRSPNPWVLIKKIKFGPHMMHWREVSRVYCCT